MGRPKIYVAGPMRGLTYDQANEWRLAAESALPECDIFSPMRGKEYLRDLDVIPGAVGDKMSSSQAIYIRDRWDVRTADAILVYLLGAKEISIGTCFEMAWATAYNIPVVIVMKEGDVHEHPFVRQAAWIVVDSLHEGLNALRILLNLRPEDGGYSRERLEDIRIF